MIQTEKKQLNLHSLGVLLHINVWRAEVKYDLMLVQIFCFPEVELISDVSEEQASQKSTRLREKSREKDT